MCALCAPCNVANVRCFLLVIIPSPRLPTIGPLPLSGHASRQGVSRAHGRHHQGPHPRRGSAAGVRANVSVTTPTLPLPLPTPHTPNSRSNHGYCTSRFNCAFFTHTLHSHSHTLTHTHTLTLTLTPHTSSRVNRAGTTLPCHVHVATCSCSPAFVDVGCGLPRFPRHPVTALFGTPSSPASWASTPRCAWRR